MILFGHPSGNPNSHHAALAHFEAGWLEALCVPWMPSEGTLRILSSFPAIRPMADRLARRRFAPLAGAPRIHGRVSEWWRLSRRALGISDERLSYEANDWLMRTMRRECRRTTVTAIHSYEDCSLWQFEAAKRAGKACIYDLPIGFYASWQRTRLQLLREFSEWVPKGGVSSSRFERPAQKLREMQLADLVLAPSAFVERTVREFDSRKAVARAAYGVDSCFWQGGEHAPIDRPLRFIFAGQLSLRKGIPLLMQAWRAAGLENCTLELVGTWQLAENKIASLPRGVAFTPPCARNELRERYSSADVFVFPSYFEGFGLVLLEAMACGLPVIASEASGADADLLDESRGRLVPTGELDALVEALRWFDRHRDRLPAMSRAARAAAEQRSWEAYRRRVTDAVKQFA